MACNCFSCFNPPVTDDDTNTDPSTPRAAPSSSHARPSTPRATGPSTSLSAGSSSSPAAERGRVDSKGKKKQGPSGHDQLAKDKKKLKFNLNFEVGSSSQDIRSFNLEELQVATENFSSECLGKGGFGKVYKAHFDNENQDAAIKILNLKGNQGIEEFLMEVEVLKNANHPNIVKLLGFCAEGKKHRLLVYEYMALGSLHCHLFDSPPDTPPLDWKTRFKIAIDIARGLEYLHDRIIPSIIHLDVKSPNILLDKEYHAKLSDFGTAIVSPVGDETHVSRKIIGSLGFIAPEYHKNGHSTHKTDIYSFGVVLLELITGRKAYDSKRLEREQHLVEWARPLFMIQDRIVLLADPTLAVQYNKDSLNGALDLAERCVDLEATKRPVIVEVVQALDKCHPPTNDPQIHLESSATSLQNLLLNEINELDELLEGSIQINTPLELELSR